jgi:hypothetical protein
MSQLAPASWMRLLASLWEGSPWDRARSLTEGLYHFCRGIYACSRRRPNTLHYIAGTAHASSLNVRSRSFFRGKHPGNCTIPVFSDRGGNPCGFPWLAKGKIQAYLLTGFMGLTLRRFTSSKTRKILPPSSDRKESLLRF